ncbi:MAG: 5'-methylthioadenosine/S-adenosylhomocysteine nucleosidase [Oscillospiraceae bacterium]|nr:5'-methylthioadenosine/S-adenosylhomocysteine nucleosidase [Oscillospiraceae bacterium]
MKKKIAVLVAMGMEADCLIKRIENARTEKAGGRTFLRGTVGSAEVVLYRCGWGMRRAADGARALIGYARPDALLLYGVSGAIVPTLRIADTVVAEASFATWGKAFAAGLSQPTDETLANFAAGVLGEAQKAPVATSVGVILRKKRNARIAAASGALCTDMESYAVAKAAAELDMPLLVIRSISDTFERISLLAFLKNGKIAAERAALDTETVIKALAENP